MTGATNNWSDPLMKSPDENLSQDNQDNDSSAQGEDS